MRFMLNIQVKLPGEWGPEQRAEITRREIAVAVDLMHRGVMRRVFRIVGRTGSFAIWETESLEQLHELVQTLPMFPFMTIAVTPIIKHPVEEAYEREHGAVPPL